jgi:NAD(P)-dependent dehydrogenase (short-subunit alcohol dehydrogenase family)
METSTSSLSVLNGKKVIVLGASSGIGLATAKAAALEGAQIVIVSGNQERIDAALKELPASSEGYAVDLRDEKNIKTLFEQMGNFDHLVYTASSNISPENLVDMDLETAHDYFKLRFWSPFAAIKYAVPRINPGGSITLTSGIANPRPGKGWALGASTSGAMEGLTRAMAVELAPIRVNIVSPGVVKTNLWSSLTETGRENFYKTVGDAMLVGRVGGPEDIAQTYLYLMKQQFSTGQVIIVDGGAVLV